MKGGEITSYITTHSLARELLEQPDGFLTVSIGEEEYTIRDYQRKKTHANIDDSMMYWTLNLCNNRGKYEKYNNVCQ